MLDALRRRTLTTTSWASWAEWQEAYAWLFAIDDRTYWHTAIVTLIPINDQALVGFVMAHNAVLVNFEAPPGCES